MEGGLLLIRDDCCTWRFNRKQVTVSVKRKLQTIVFTIQMSTLKKIVPLFSNPKNNSLQSVRRLHFTLPHTKLNIAVQDVVQPTF